MKSQRRLISLKLVALLICALFVGCTPKIDGSSVDAFAQSARKIAEKLPPQERAAFNSDVMRIGTLGHLNLRELSQQLDGKSAIEIRAIAIEAEAKKEQEVAALKEKQIQDYLAEQAQAVAQSKEVKLVHVSSPAAFTVTPDRTFVILVEVKNGSSVPIAQFSLDAKLECDALPDGSLTEFVGAQFAPPLAPGATGTATIERRFMVPERTDLSMAKMNLVLTEISTNGSDVYRSEVPTGLRRKLSR